MSYCVTEKPQQAVCICKDTKKNDNSERSWYFFPEQISVPCVAPMKTAADKGRAEGRAEGIEQTKRENARKMKAKGYPIADIADITGLAPEDIEKL